MTRYEASRCPKPYRPAARQDDRRAIRRQIERVTRDQAPPYPPVRITANGMQRSMIARILRILAAWLMWCRQTPPTATAPMQDKPASAIALPKPMRGATAAHWRAFSNIQVRNDGRELRERLATLRTLAKKVKTLDDPAHDDAVRVLDAFATLVDAYRPLWDAGGDVVSGDERSCLGVERRTIPSVDILIRQLEALTTPPASSGDELDTVARFVEQRYGSASGDFGLKPVG